MEVIKRQNGILTKCEYPRADKEPVIGLDSDIEFFEIKQIPYPPEYDSNKHTLKEEMKIVGEYCEVRQLIIDKPKSEVLQNFNIAFGNFIDNAYPIWKRVKDISEQSEAGIIRQAQEASLREARMEIENDYLTKNIFPNFKFYWL